MHAHRHLARQVALKNPLSALRLNPKAKVIAKHKTPKIKPAPRQPFRLPCPASHGARTARHVSRTKRQGPEGRFPPTKTTRAKVSNQAQSPGITRILGKTGAG